MSETTSGQTTASEWTDLASFLAIARHGGLSSAAREIGSSAPTLTRRMRALERRLGRELFVRGTHGYDLTEDGERLRDALAPAETAIARATAPADSATRPLVKIAAGSWTALALARDLASLAGAPPDVRIRLLASERIVSLGRREAAIGFRQRAPQEAGLAGRRLRPVTFAPYAAPGALDEWIVVRADTPSARWTTERCGSRIGAETDTPRLALDLALAGFGRLVLPTFVGDATPGLARTDRVIDALSNDQWLVTHDEDRRLSGVRRTLDRIAERFG